MRTGSVQAEFDIRSNTMLSILNSISSLNAENAISNTTTALNKNLQQLSTGLRINSGSDDAAGLSIANGLQANIAALNQSSDNVSDGVGLLQTADGALSQVVTLLNRAVTLATEASNGGLSASQATALDNEYKSIQSEINTIGSTTNFNGTSVFAGTETTLQSTQGSAGAPLATTDDLTSGSVTTIHDSNTGGTFVFTAGGSSTIASLQSAITAAAGTTLSTGTALTIVGGKVQIAGPAGDSLTISTNDAVLGSFAPTGGSGGTSTVFTSDGTASGGSDLTTAITALSATGLGLTDETANTALDTTTGAQAELQKITSAISQIAASRGTIGAAVNQLDASQGVQSTEVTNLTSAVNSIQNADIGQVVSAMTQNSVLEQTGMAALSQSNQLQQNVLKLLQ
jgi:flagellin